MGTVKNAMKAVFNDVAQRAEDTFSGMWFESMSPAVKIAANGFGLAGIWLAASSPTLLGAAISGLIVAHTASTFYIAGRNLRTGAPQP